GLRLPKPEARTDAKIRFVAQKLLRDWEYNSLPTSMLPGPRDLERLMSANRLGPFNFVVEVLKSGCHQYREPQELDRFSILARFPSNTPKPDVIQTTLHRRYLRPDFLGLSMRYDRIFERMGRHFEEAGASTLPAEVSICQSELLDPETPVRAEVA